MLDDLADKRIAEGSARRLSVEEAEAALRHANERGLVHMTIYRPEHDIAAVCSCCACCCHNLQALQVVGRTDWIARSEYIAQTAAERCTHCAKCVERCVFEARVWQDGRMSYDADHCYGCGLCATTCPSGATTMRQRSELTGRTDPVA